MCARALNLMKCPTVRRVTYSPVVPGELCDSGRGRAVTLMMASSHCVRGRTSQWSVKLITRRPIVSWSQPLVPTSEGSLIHFTFRHTLHSSVSARDLCSANCFGALLVISDVKVILPCFLDSKLLSTVFICC